MSKVTKNLIVAFAISVAMTGNVFAKTRDVATEESNRKLVVEFYEAFFNQHDTSRATELVAEDYRQHNPEVPDGRKPFLEYFTDFFKGNPQSRARVIRSAADGDLGWLHVHATNGPDDRGQVVIDIFRVKNGKIVEHWDVIQEVPESPANTNSMF